MARICSALLAARSPSRLSRCSRVFLARQAWEDLTDDELCALCDDLNDRIDVLDNEGNGAPEDLIDQWSQADREMSRRAAVACRKAGGYSATFNVDGESLEYELKATNEEDAQAEAKSEATAMAHISHQTVTVERINGPITE